MNFLAIFIQKLVFFLRYRVGGAGRVRAFFWSLLGMRVGRDVVLESIHVTWPHQVTIGDFVRIEHGVYFKFDGVWSKGPSIVVGDQSFIGSGVEFNVRKFVRLGRNCLIASGVKFIDHDHGFSSRSIPVGQQSDGKELPIELGEDVWVGANAVITKGVVIGRGAIIGAGAVVTKSVPPYEIWGGVPARRIGVRP